MIKKNYECLLILTKDNKKIFTSKKNLKKIKEYARIFNAEISTVQVKEANLVELEEIAAIIVEDKKIKNDEVEYTIISTEHEKKQRNKILDTAAKIKSFIKKEFTSGHQVSVNNVLQKFKNEEITNACVCMHLKSVREELMAAGVEIEKIKHGVYQNKIFIKSEMLVQR